MITRVLIITSIVLGLLLSFRLGGAFGPNNGLTGEQTSGASTSLINDIEQHAPVTPPADSSPSAQPVFTPDTPYKIAFLSSQDHHNGNNTTSDDHYEIYTINADGSNLSKITLDNMSYKWAGRPSWSPDGTKIAYYTDIFSVEGKDRWNIPATSDRVSWSPDSKTVCFSGKYFDTHTALFSMQLDGAKIRRLTDNPSYNGGPSWSPDGYKIVFLSGRYSPAETKDTEGDALIAIEPDGSAPLRLTHDLVCGHAVWSPDSVKVAFSATDLYVINNIGTGPLLISHNLIVTGDPTWSPDGKTLAFSARGRHKEKLSYSASGPANIYLINIDASDQRQLTVNQADNLNPDWSPDGKYIVFQSTRDGNSEIYIMNADGSNQRRLTKNEGGDCHPAWSPK